MKEEVNYWSIRCQATGSYFLVLCVTLQLWEKIIFTSVGAGQLLQGQQLIGGRCEQLVLMHVSSDMEAVSGQVSGSVGTSSTSRPSGFRAGETARKWKKKPHTHRKGGILSMSERRTRCNLMHLPGREGVTRGMGGWRFVCAAVTNKGSNTKMHKDRQGLLENPWVEVLHTSPSLAKGKHEGGRVFKLLIKSKEIFA